MKQTLTQIEQIMVDGTLNDAEAFIDAGDWSDQQKAALWLYAWSHQHPEVQRTEATVLTALSG